MNMNPIVIIGTGIAGYSLAREFRKLDKETPLVLITSDDGRNYPKPLLSNALAKKKTAEQIALSTAEKMADTLPATILTHTIVETIDRTTKLITLSSGQTLTYQKLVLAVGASPFRADLEGDASDTVISINTLSDYEAFRARLSDNSSVAIIGSGLIGCEFANDLISSGYTVSVIGRTTLPMMPLLPEQLASELKTELERAGVQWYLSAQAQRIDHSFNENYTVTLSTGEVIDADIVISAIGLRANVSLAEQIGLAVNRGIKTNTYLETTDPDIYALGDCAEVVNHHLMYLAPITVGAKALSQTLTGNPTPVSYSAMPVTIKTPLYPLVVCPPPRDVDGDWSITDCDTQAGLSALFHDQVGQLRGFVLTHDATKIKQSLAQQLPDLL
jgi:rubredoxin-NAD+ reductase